MKKTLLIVLFFVYAMNVVAQDQTKMQRIMAQMPFPPLPKELVEVKGRIVDETGEGLPFATVEITLKAHPIKPYRVFVCDENGFFSTELPHQTPYSLVARYLGYKLPKPLEIALADKSVELGIIGLVLDATMLGEVVVRPLVEYNSREIVYNITSDPNREKSSMGEIMKKVPLLFFDGKGDLHVENQEKTFVILRNGREDALLNKSAMSYGEIMRRLPAMGFTKITIMIDKPERYKDYDYVINVTADPKNRIFGAVGGTSADYNLQSRGLALQQGLTGSFADLRFAAIAGYGRHRSYESANQLDRTTILDGSQLLQTNSSYTKAQSYGVDIGFSQDITKTQFLNLSFGYSHNTNDSYSDSYDKTTLQSTIISENQKNTVSNTKNNSFNLSTNYQFDFKKDSRSLIASYRYLNGPSESNTQTTTIDMLDQTIIQTRPSPKTSSSNLLGLNYIDSWGGRKVNFEQSVNYLDQGFSEFTRYFDQQGSGASIENPQRYNQIDQTIKRIDGSTRLSWAMNKNFDISTTFNWDYLLDGSTTKVHDGDRPVQNIDQQSFAYSPSITLSFLFGNKKGGTPGKMDLAQMMGRMSGESGSDKKQKPKLSLRDLGGAGQRLRLNYRMAQYRPNYRQLTTYVNENDPTNIFTGNPNLSNEIINRFNLIYSNPILSPGLHYSFSNNQISDKWYINSQGQTVKSYENSGWSQRFGVDLSKNIRYGGHFLMINFSPSYSKSKSENRYSEGFSILGSTMVVGNFFNNKLNYTLMMHYMDNWIKGYAISKGNPFSLMLVLGGTTSLGKDKSFKVQYSVNVENVFNWSSTSRQYIDNDLFQQSVVSTQNTVPIRLNLKFTYGKFKYKPVKATKTASRIEGFSK